MWKRWLAIVLFAVAPARCAVARPNVILVVTDDQRWDELDAMPTVAALRQRRTVAFTNAFAPTPVCCPARATILTGLYAHTHGVRTLDGTRFVGPDAETLAVWLRRRRYRTALVGKYVNGYAALGPPARPTWYVPPGWDRWRALVPSAYYDYAIVDEAGVATGHGSAPEDYSTDVLRDQAVAFVRESLAAGRRFFLYFAPYAPHPDWPAFDPVPAPRHLDRLTGLAPYRPPSFMEPDVSDKPARSYAIFLGAAFLDAHRQRRLESLLAVDDAVAALLAAVAEAGADRRTIVVFTSDNGYLLGEHRLLGKPHPYEECHRVPLLVHDPRRRGARRTDAHLVTHVDIAPTVAGYAGARTSPVEGRSLRPLIRGLPVRWRKSFPLEAWSVPDGAVQYRGVRTTRWSWVEYPATGEQELYDLDADPYQLENQAANPALANTAAELRNETLGLHAGD